MKNIESKRTIHLLSGLVIAALVSSVFPSLAYSAPVNYALGKAASASSSYNENGYAIEKGNDGDINTIWNGGGGSAWWQVDLGSTYSIDHINVFSVDGNGYHTKFQLSSSTDGLAWVNIGLETVKYGDPVTFHWDATFDTNAGSMRYVRYTTIGEGGSDWATLAELQAVGGDQGQIPEPASLALIALALAGLGAVSRGSHKRTSI